MTKFEKYILDDLEQIKDDIRSPTIEQLIRETHENNLMLRHIIKIVNAWVINANKENNDDFARNVLANLISGVFDINKLFNKNGNNR